MPVLLVMIASPPFHMSLYHAKKIYQQLYQLSQRDCTSPNGKSTACGIAAQPTGLYCVGWVVGLYYWMGVHVVEHDKVYIYILWYPSPPVGQGLLQAFITDTMFIQMGTSSYITMDHLLNSACLVVRPTLDVMGCQISQFLLCPSFLKVSFTVSVHWHFSKILALGTILYEFSRLKGTTLATGTFPSHWTTAVLTSYISMLTWVVDNYRNRHPPPQL